MKKIIPLLLFVLTASMVMSSFFDVSFIQRSNYSSALRSLAPPNAVITEYDIKTPSPENLDNLITTVTGILETTDSTGAVYTAFDTTSQTMVYQSFIFVPHDPVLEQFFLTEGQPVKFSELMNGYLSSDITDVDAYGHLDFTDRFNQNSESIQIQIYPLDSAKFKQFCENAGTIALYISSDNQQEVQNLLNQSGLQIKSTFEHENRLEPGKNAMSDLLPYILFIALGACVCMILNESKKIRILAVQGLSPTQIFCVLFLKYYLVLTGVCISLVCLTYLLLAQDFRPVNHLFFEESVKITFLLMGLIVLIASCTWLYILLFVRGMRKDQKHSERLSGMMVVVQLICLIGIVPMMDTSFWQVCHYWQRVDILKKSEAVYLSYKTIGGLTDLSKEQQEELAKLVEEAGVIYQHLSEIPDEYLDPDYSELAAMGWIPSSQAMEVNLNWVRESGFLNVLFDGSDLQSNVSYVLIPENRQDILTNLISIYPGMTPVLYKSGQKVQNLNFSSRDLILDDPIILVLADWEPGGMGVSFSDAGSYYLKTDSSNLRWLTAQLQKSGLENLWVDRVSLFHLTLNDSETNMEEQGMRFLLTFMIMVVLLYSVMRIYLVENEKLSFVRTISGEYFEEAMLRFIKLTGLSYIVAGIWLAISHQCRSYTLYWLIFLFLMEVVLFRIMYRRWQKKELQLLLREE